MTRKSADAALQKAIFERLTTAFRGYKTSIGIFDTPPGDRKMPYIVIGENSGVPYDTKTELGQDVISTIHVWSEKPSYTEVKEIKAKAIEAITESEIDLSEAGFEVQAGSLNIPLDTAFTDIDGKTKHGVIKINLQIQQN